MGLALLFGGPVLLAVLMAASIVGSLELYRIYNINKNTLGIIGYIYTIVYYIVLYLGNEDICNIMLVLYVVFVLAIYVLGFPKYSSNQMMCGFFGFFYVTVMLSYVYRIRVLDNGIYFVWLIFICSWINDTCAYLTGICIGKHKMTPKLSPKKTIEGAVGGIVGTGIVGFVFAYIFADKLLVMQPLMVVPALCCVGALVSIIGDLAASAIKRNNDVKDYGTLIPGHGGILDRFDSVIIVAPIIFWCITIFG